MFAIAKNVTARELIAFTEKTGKRFVHKPRVTTTKKVPPVSAVAPVQVVDQFTPKGEEFPAISLEQRQRNEIQRFLANNYKDYAKEETASGATAQYFANVYA